MPAEKVMKKHVAIIHAYSLMSALQRKIFNVLLYEAYEAIKDKRILNHQNSVCVEQRISFNKLCNAVKFNSNNTQYLKEAIDSLASLKIEWNLLKDKVPTNISFLNLRVLHGSPTFYQDGTLNFSFHQVMLDLIENPSIYGLVNLDVQSEFESKYSHSLYENSTRFVNLHKNKIVQLETFKKLLGVNKNKYPSMREFKRNVLTPSVEEVNDRANFVVRLESIKIGRRIAGFEILVKSKKITASLENQIDFSKKEKILKEIKETFGTLSNHVLENILKNYSEEYLIEKITYTKKHAKKENSGLYPIPYFISAIRDNYAEKKKAVQEHIFANENQWKNKLYALQADLNHWNKLLENADTGQNIIQKNSLQKIISQCEQKLQKHLLENPEECKETV